MGLPGHSAAPEDPDEPDELAELDANLAAALAGSLSADACARCVELASAAPGKMRAVAEALAAQRTAPAVDALLRLPVRTPGVLEGVFQAIRHGVARRRPDTGAFARRLALDFRHGRARDFATIVERAHRAFGADHAEAGRFERLSLDDHPCYRVTVTPGHWPPGLAVDVAWLQRRLGRLRGSRLWLNGWCFPQDGPMPPAAQAHLVDAWLAWACTPRAREGSPR